MTGENKKPSQEVASQGMTDADLKKLQDLAELKFGSVFQGVISPDTVGNHDPNNL